MKIIKQQIAAKTRQLNATWSVSYDTDMDVTISDELSKMLAEQIQQEMDFEILTSLLVTQGYKLVKLDLSDKVSEVVKWCDSALVGKVSTYGGRNWLFQNEEDIPFFLLRWSSECS